MRPLSAADLSADREDDRLLLRIAAGDQAALARLIDRQGKGLRLFAARYLRNEQDAEDVVQDVFVSVWRHAKRFDPKKARASTWLYKITANRCIDASRRRRFRAFIGLEDIENSLADGAPDAADDLSARQQLSMVRAALAGLPERQRMAILLRSVGDLDVPAIAEVMGSSAGSVEQLLVRGRRTLRDVMQNNDDTKGTGR